MVETGIQQVTSNHDILFLSCIPPIVGQAVACHQNSVKWLGVVAKNSVS
jgi:hypothetical protein